MFFFFWRGGDICCYLFFLLSPHCHLGTYIFFYYSNTHILDVSIISQILSPYFITFTLNCLSFYSSQSIIFLFYCCLFLHTFIFPITLLQKALHNVQTVSENFMPFCLETSFLNSFSSNLPVHRSVLDFWSLEQS